MTFSEPNPRSDSLFVEPLVTTLHDAIGAITSRDVTRLEQAVAAQQEIMSAMPIPTCHDELLREPVCTRRFAAEVVLYSRILQRAHAALRPLMAFMNPDDFYSPESLPRR